MPEKPFKSYAPFGVATKRFTKIGFHPELDRSGAMKLEITKLGPGSFHPKEPQCKSKQGMRWRQKLELEEFSKYLGFRNAPILFQRNFYKSMGGPGSCDVNEALFRRERASKMENVGFGSGPRIGKDIMGQEAPPPDTYFREVSEKMETSKKSFSKLPTFEYDGLVDRFKSEAKPYHLPSNLYNADHKKNVADITRKVVSTRGPYDCFTGPRDGTTIKNHFSPALSQGPDYFYIKPSDLEYLIKHPSKKRCGLFLKASRFQTKPTVRNMLNDLSLCYRNPNDPGPAHYNIQHTSIKKYPSSKHPFDSSNMNARPPIDWRISPGPGRYNPKAPRCMKVKKPSWVFLSKADRSLVKPQNYSLFEQP